MATIPELSVPAKIGAFVAALAAVATIAVGVGRWVGPLDDAPAPQPGHHSVAPTEHTPGH